MKFSIIIFTTLLFALTVSAQTRNAKIEKEIIDFRGEIRQAVKAEDRKSLEKSLAGGFTHTHASGKVDGKIERIDFFIAGEPTVEDFEPEEIRIVVFNKNLASAVGKTTLTFGAEKRSFQWTGVFKLDEAGVKTVYAADSLETSPLAQAEWLKFDALFFNREKDMETYFNDVEKKYETLAAKTRDVPNKPTAVANGIYKGAWNLPGGKMNTVNALIGAPVVIWILMRRLSLRSLE